jgi:hypothetical protein
MASRRFLTVEIKAGLLLTFCLGLFVAMLFVYGKATRRWRGRQELRVVFSSVGSLRRDARVLYNGLEVGRVQDISILPLNDATLALLPPFTERELGRLPLTDEEREALRGLPADELDREARRLAQGRNMVRLDLDVLAGPDQQRYRQDDQISITTTLMGDSAVEIVSGSGPPLKPGQPQLYLGISGDMYGNLAKSMEQMRDILSSISEMIGGGESSTMAERVGNFDQFTDRLDSLARTFEEKLPKSWDSIEERLGRAKERSAAMARRVSERGSEWSKALTDAQGEMEKWRAEAASSIKSPREKIADWKGRARKELESLAAQVREQKAPLPMNIRKAREWTENITDRVTSIDRQMTHFDRELTQGTESVRQMLQALRELAENVEERLWYLANYPWTVASPPRGLEGLALHGEWRKALMTRHYRELRDELARARKEYQPRDASDQARVNRIDRALTEMDQFLGVRPGAK